MVVSGDGMPTCAVSEGCRSPEAVGEATASGADYTSDNGGSCEVRACAEVTEFPIVEGAAGHEFLGKAGAAVQLRNRYDVLLPDMEEDGDGDDDDQCESEKDGCNDAFDSSARLSKAAVARAAAERASKARRRRTKRATAAAAGEAMTKGITEEGAVDHFVEFGKGEVQGPRAPEAVALAVAASFICGGGQSEDLPSAQKAAGALSREGAGAETMRVPRAVGVRTPGRTARKRTRLCTMRRTRSFPSPTPRTRRTMWKRTRQAQAMGARSVPKPSPPCIGPSR